MLRLRSGVGFAVHLATGEGSFALTMIKMAVRLGFLERQRTLKIMLDRSYALSSVAHMGRRVNEDL